MEKPSKKQSSGAGIRSLRLNLKLNTKMSIYYNQLRAMIAEKAPRKMSEMAHYHAITDLELPKAKQDAALNMFCFVECLKPSTPHPIHPDEKVMGYEIEVGRGNKALLWMKEDGELTDVAEDAAIVPASWDYTAESRDLHRSRGYAGFQKAKDIIRSLGVPRSIRIYDNAS